MAHHLNHLKSELAPMGAALHDDVVVSQIHIGEGTPILLPADMIADLGAVLSRFRPRPRRAL